MKKYLIYPLRGTINAIFMALATTGVAVGVYLVALIILMTPVRRVRVAMKKFLHRFPVYWIDLLGFSMRLTAGRKWRISGSGRLDAGKPYLLLCNHISWLDILVLSEVFHRKTPCMKFFMKKQLLWSLPFAGLATWILGYPFMARHTREQIRKNPALKNKDLQTTQQACQKFIEHPSTIMNFVEGTRFTEKKRIQKSSPYRYLLKPKTAGIAIVLNALQQDLSGIIDATIAYQPQHLSFWHFLCGNFDNVICHYRVLPIEALLLGNYHEDREYRKRLQAWLNDIWQQKDTQLQGIYDPKGML